jgi:PKD repeat protein
MPIIISGRRGRRMLATALGLAALTTTPAHAATIANPYDCTPQPALTQTFLAWRDYGLYTPVTNQGVENGSTGWTLSGGAAVVNGNEPWKVAGASDAKSLDLPAGSSAVTAPLCIDRTYPYFQLFARNAGTAWATMRIETIFFDSRGNVMSIMPYTYRSSSSAWQPTGTVKISVFTPYTTASAAPVAFRFTPIGPGSHYQIDDVYVDPWARS